MPNHDWYCTVCQASNPAYTEACRFCYTPAALESYVRHCKCGAVLNESDVACGKCLSASQTSQPTNTEEPTEIPGYWKEGVYVPNQITWKARAYNIIFSVQLLTYGSYGVFVDDLFIPAKRGPGVHFHGIPAWLMYGAFCSTSISMLAVIADHLDYRPNEGIYKATEKYAGYTGWGLYVLAYLVLSWHKP